MKSLVHSVYRHGHAGLSNLVMSVELGVVLASLMDRVLILNGNKAPSGNVVQYGDLVSNDPPSRVTDLIDLGTPWLDGGQIDLTALAPREICDQPAWESVFYLPNTLVTDSRGFRVFAGSRRNFFTVDDELQHLPTLSVSGGGDGNTLSYYSSFFYLDSDNRPRMHDALRRMKPKAELAAFADLVARNLGAFNAVHIRRGDFQRSIGANTKDRTGAEAIAAMDRHFDRDKRLVILTDEADDPFFDEIKDAYSELVFLDWYILQNYGQKFRDLPTHDSIALAYLSQLIASFSDDFIGTLNSTYTGLIQRYRGNRGKDEKFKFLWSALPAAFSEWWINNNPEQHPEGTANCIRLDKGVMVEEGRGPYTWNRVDQRLNTGWMREWPEAFTDEAAIRRCAAAREGFEAASEIAPCHSVTFIDHTVAVGSNDTGLSAAIGSLFSLMVRPKSEQPIANVTLEVLGQQLQLLLNGSLQRSGERHARLLRDLYREVVRQFIFKYPNWIWLHASCVASEEGAIILPGSWGRGKSTLALQLYNEGWSFLSDDVVPFDPVTATAIPFPATPQVRQGTEKTLTRDQLSRLSKVAVSVDVARVAEAPAPISMIVFPHFQAGVESVLQPITPGQSVGALLENCLSFPQNTDETIQQLCATVEGLPTYKLSFSDPTDAAATLENLQKSTLGSRFQAAG